jgi:hypothetical protein
VILWALIHGFNIKEEQKMPNGRDLRHILERIYNHESLVGIDLRNLYLFV